MQIDVSGARTRTYSTEILSTHGSPLPRYDTGVAVFGEKRRKRRAPAPLMKLT
jgi:hypothetical protein